jgi:hypothetical protein
MLPLQSLQLRCRVDEASPQIGRDVGERLNHSSHRNEEIMRTRMRGSAPS